MISDVETLEMRACCDAAERAIVGAGRSIRRIVALAECRSTQDSAAEMAASESGVLVFAGRQSDGRGRLGRRWVQRGGLGIACTLAFAATEETHRFVSLAAGVAAAQAIEDVFNAAPIAPSPVVGIRWPNDVVERSSGRKLAGVLIEARQVAGRKLLLIGIGINVGQESSDWPSDLVERAVSLRQLGSAADRPLVLAALVSRLDEALGAIGQESGRAVLLEAWKRRDVLLGTTRTFTFSGARVGGLVESIEPTLEIVIRQSDGLGLVLQAGTTSLVAN